MNKRFFGAPVGGKGGGIPFRRSRLAAALAVSLGFAGVAHGQATMGSIYGTAPVAPGETVKVVNTGTGLVRQAEVDSQGHYQILNLPIGQYTVSLIKGTQTVATQENVSVLVGSGTAVPFAGSPGESAKNLEALVVTGNALPAIDVTKVDQSTVITAQQLAKLPLERSAEAIAMLAPGVSAGSSYFSGPLGSSLVSISGASVTENAYYINGFNTTDPLSGFGGITLPYGAIESQETKTSGYGAAYGRSDGGVLSMIGKRGSNTWHFGGQLLWTPIFARADPKNIWYPQNTSSRAGKIYQYREDNKGWNGTADGYFGGPLIQDKLFLFVAVEGSRSQGQSIGNIGAPYNTKYRYMDPKNYIKLDWNINDNNILEFTHVGNKDQYQGSKYNYSYATGQTGSFNSFDTSTKTSAKDNILKYTGYLTDNLTVSALAGKQKITYYNQTPGYDPAYNNVFGTQNPALTGTCPNSTCLSPNTIATLDNPAHQSTNTNFRFDVSYKLGQHTLTAGIDNMNVHDVDDGTSTTGPGGYAWDYGFVKPGTNISDSPFVDDPSKYPGGSTGYYVSKYIYDTAASVRVKQRAQYVQDDWQVTDRWLVQIGLRNDQFTNYNPNGDAFLRLTKPQWAPRLGFSWDVFGDSSFKVYGSAGRYYLAMPASVALRAAGGSLYTNTYYTYTGIDPTTGYPTGLTPIDTVNGAGQPVSANAEYGQLPDPNSVAAKNIKSQHQDEYVLGFDKQLAPNWTYGVSGVVRHLRSGLDDICDTDTIYAKAAALGYDVNNIDSSKFSGCFLSNPGQTNVYALPLLSGGYVNVPVTAADFGMPQMKRSYYALDAYLEHSFDGKWMGRVDYIYSRSYGNSEGQVRSDIGQTDVSATVDWDYGYFESYANGYLENDHKHTLKAYGSYQINPEWMVAANLLVQSGSPRSCLGYYGSAGTNPTGYGPYYHWCDGQPSPPGKAGRNPWTEILNLNAEYRPAFADHKLAFNVDLFNVFNQQRTLQTYPIYGRAGAVVTSYGRTLSYSTPRYMRFGISYDF